MWENFKTFMARPFSADMSALNWVAFIGLLLVIMLFWRIVLYHMKELAE